MTPASTTVTMAKCEIASQLDPRIRTKLFSQPASVQTSPRDSFRCVMSEWYNIAAESESTSIPFRLDTLIDVLRNDNVRLFELARELGMCSHETIEDRSRTKVKGITFRRSLPYLKPRSISFGGSYTSISGGGAAIQSNLREASSEVFLQSPREGRQRNTSERALSPKERNGIVKEIIGQVWGSLKHFIDPAALGSRRSLKSIGSLDSISEEHHPDNFSKSEACLYNPEAEPVSLYNEVYGACDHEVKAGTPIQKRDISVIINHTSLLISWGLEQ